MLFCPAPLYLSLFKASSRLSSPGQRCEPTLPRVGHLVRSANAQGPPYSIQVLRPDIFFPPPSQQQFGDSSPPTLRLLARRALLSPPCRGWRPPTCRLR